MKSSSTVSSGYGKFKMLVFLLSRVKRYFKSITVIFLTYLVTAYFVLIIQTTSYDSITTLKSYWLFLSNKTVH